MFKNKLKAQMALKGITGKDLAKAIGINEATFYRKMLADGSFTRQELKTMRTVLDVKDPISLFFDD